MTGSSAVFAYGSGGTSIAIVTPWVISLRQRNLGAGALSVNAQAPPRAILRATGMSAVNPDHDDSAQAGCQLRYEVDVAALSPRLRSRYVALARDAGTDAFLAQAARGRH